LAEQSICSRLAGYDDTNAADRLTEGTQRFGFWPPANGGRRASRSPQPSTGSRDGGPRWGAELPRASSPQYGTDPAASAWSTNRRLIL